jgi:hypothetical protein
MTRISGTLHEDLHTFIIILYRILLKIKVSHKSYRENQNIHFVSSNFFPQQLWEIMWHNMIEPDRLQMTIRYMKMMRFTCRKTMARIQTIIIFYTCCFITDCCTVSHKMFYGNLLTDLLHEAKSFLRS